MPSQNNNPQDNQTQKTAQPQASAVPSAVSMISPQADLPPLPPAFQNVGSKQQNESGQKPGGTASPTKLPPIISSMPRKKFGGGRVIATLLGILLLVSGVGAGLILTTQQQLFQPQAKAKRCIDIGNPNERKKCELNAGGGSQTNNPSCTCPGGTGASCSGCKTGDLVGGTGQIYCATCSLSGGATICAKGYTPDASHTGCVPMTGGGGGGGGGSSSAQCSSVTAYSSTWSPLTSSGLSAATVGETVNFCVGGTTSAGGFDMAKFTITANGTDGSPIQSSTKGQGAAASLFCTSYQIPSGITSFSIKGQIHDSSLGWSN